MLYRHNAPSNTSLSDDCDDDEPCQSNFFKVDQLLFNIDAAVQPHWSSTFAQPIPTRSLKALLTSPVSILPPEILISIFKYLHSPRDLLSALRVSRTWCECTVELLWHKPTFTRYSTLEKMARLLRKAKQTFPYARFVRRLNFLSSGSDLRDDTLAVFSRCVRLERLTLTGCKLITPTSLEQVLTCFPNLVAVDLTSVVETTAEVVSAFASVAKRLQGINLSNCNKVTDPALVALGENCPLLRRVKLSGLTLITDLGVSAIVRNCPLLLEIDLHQCELITDVAVRNIWIYSAQMREMRLSQCSALTDLAFPALNSAVNPFPSADPNALPPLHVSRVFEQLRLLDLTACTLISDDAVEGIVAHAPKIRSLVLAKCGSLTDRTVDAICGLGKHLHYLHLGHANRITDGSVKTLARSCTRIRYIDFANCTKLTDMSVFELSALPKLRRIGLVRVTNLTDEAVYSLAERHSTLERIHLSYCDQISVMAVHFLLLKLHKLTHLSLSGVPAFRQTNIQRFCREAPKDFNTAQRQNFCVFSGKGVSQLRSFLTELFDNITEQNGTDDTEYEDEDYFPMQDLTPEGENPDTDDDAAAYHVISPNVNVGRGTRWARHEAISLPTYSDPAAQLTQHRRALPTFSLPPLPAIGDERWAPSDAAVQGATTRLNQIQAITRDNRPSRRGRGGVADVLPIVEPVSPVSRSPGTVSESEPSAGSSAPGFFQTFREPVFTPVDPGAMTPDLHYAEIGHGRGATAQRGLSPGSSHHGPQQRHLIIQGLTPRQPYTTITAALQDDGQPPRPPSNRAMSDPGSTPAEMLVDGEEWVRQSVPEPDTIRELEASVHSALTTIATRSSRRPARDHRTRDREYYHQRGTGSASGSGSGSGNTRGRSVRRTIRNGLNAAESYASNFLFGRHWAEEGSSEHAPGSNQNQAGPPAR